MNDKAEAIKPDMDAHKTPEAWAKEGAELARHAVYLDGELLKARDDGEGVLQAPAGYAQEAGRTARVQIGKAGKRLGYAMDDLIPFKEQCDSVKIRIHHPTLAGPRCPIGVSGGTSSGNVISTLISIQDEVTHGYIRIPPDALRRNLSNGYRLLEH